MLIEDIRKLVNITHVHICGLCICFTSYELFKSYLALLELLFAASAVPHLW